MRSARVKVHPGLAMPVGIACPVDAEVFFDAGAHTVVEDPRAAHAACNREHKRDRMKRRERLIRARN